ncbi:hypothetical protein L1887_58587 [Cichorium endivia]|nr:hypothetical protein L1887_58587 [Cichorium endivia]
MREVMDQPPDRREQGAGRCEPNWTHACRRPHSESDQPLDTPVRTRIKEARPSSRANGPPSQVPLSVATRRVHFCLHGLVGSLPARLIEGQRWS